jgi:hypothetical protein
VGTQCGEAVGWVHLTFADISSGKLTIEISTAKRKNRGNLSIFHCVPGSFTRVPICLMSDSTVPEPRELMDYT